MRGAAGLRAVALACGVAVGAPVGEVRAEFWPVQFFLQQTTEQQRAYVIGFIDMWEHVRKAVAPDPADRMTACVRQLTTDQVRSRFVDWVLAEPALWRLNTADLFLQAMEDICRR